MEHTEVQSSLYNQSLYAYQADVKAVDKKVPMYTKGATSGEVIELAANLTFRTPAGSASIGPR